MDITLGKRFLTSVPVDTDSRWQVSTLPVEVEIHQVTHPNSEVVAKGVNQCKVIVDIVPGWTAIDVGDAKGFIQTPARRG